VRQVETSEQSVAEMPVAVEADVTDLNAMRPCVADNGGADLKTVAVKLARGAVVVKQKADLRRVAFAQEILPENVADVDVLMARVETVQAAVGVLLQLGKIGGVELILIVGEAAEETRAEVVVGVDEAAKIRDKRLNTGAHRDEVEVGVHVFEFHFGEGFFKGDVCVGAVRAPARVDVDDAALARVDVVGQADGWARF
jgi:hypothetical protein